MQRLCQRRGLSETMGHRLIPASLHTRIRGVRKAFSSPTLSSIALAYPKSACPVTIS